MDQNRKVQLASIITELVHTLSDQEKKEIFQAVLQVSDSVPLAIFSSSLPGLEALTVYLKQEKRWSIKKIAQNLNRSKNTIYTSYNKGKKKEFLPKATQLSSTVPLNIFADRKFSILESLIAYLKREQQFSLIEAARLLNKNYNTVKTVYHRYQQKCK